MQENGRFWTNRPQRDKSLSVFRSGETGPSSVRALALRSYRNYRAPRSKRIRVFQHGRDTLQFLRDARFYGLLGLIAFNQKLVPNLGSAPEDRVGRQFQNAFGMAFWPGDPKRTHKFAQAHHLEILVDQYQIEGKQHSNGMHCVSGHDPDAAVRLQRPSPKQAN